MGGAIWGRRRYDFTSNIHLGTAAASRFSYCDYWSIIEMDASLVLDERKYTLSVEDMFHISAKHRRVPSPPKPATLPVPKPSSI